MRYNQFYPGDRVITITDYSGTPSGAIGSVVSRWMGTGYLVRLPDGMFKWLNDRDFVSTDPASHKIEVGDVGMIASDKYQDFAKVGEKFQVAKIAYDVDYYGVLINNELKWLGGFQLAKYT
jgi:hypothetical protein